MEASVNDLLRMIGEQAVKIDILERELAAADQSIQPGDIPTDAKWGEIGLHSMAAEALAEIREAASD